MNYRLVILGLLAEGPTYGYQVKTYFRTNVAFPAEINNNTLYPLLRGLVRDGLATRVENEGAGRSGRMTYKITEAGRNELARIVSELPQTSVSNQEDFFVATRFLKQMSPDVRREFLDAREKQVRESISLMKEMPLEDDPAWHCVYDHGMAALENEINLIEELRSLTD